MTSLLHIVVSTSVLLASLGANAQSATNLRLAPMAGESVAETPLMMPQDLPGERTLILIAFEREQSKITESWVTGLQLLNGKTPWDQLIVVGPQNAFVKGMIMRGIRRENPDRTRQTHMFTVFSEQSTFAASLGMVEANAYAAVVDRKGTVLAMAAGSYSAAKAAPLLAALRQ